MRRLMLFSLAFASAVAAYLWLLPTSGILPCAIVCGGLFFLLQIIRRDAVKRIRILALGAALGLMWTWCYERTRLEPLRALCGDEVTLSGEVCELPERTDYGSRVLIRIDGGRTYFYLDEAAMSLSLGDRITATGRVTDVSGTDDNLYFQAQDISLLLVQTGDYFVETAQRLPLRLYPAAVAAAVRATVTRIFPAETEGFVRALLTGDRSGLSYALKNELSITGIAHVIAVSGMHVSLLIGVIRLLFGRKRFSAFVCIAIMIFFAAMLGFSPSVTRAVIMNTILLLAPLLRHENDAPTTLSFALFLLLVLNPWSLASVSLQLSFLSMAGIFLITPRLFERISERLGTDNDHLPTGYRRILRSVAISVSTTLGASFLTMPLVAVYFETISVISVVTNIVLLPVISLIFTLCVCIAVPGLIWTPLGAVPALAVSVLIRFVLWATSLLAKLPFAALYAESPYFYAWLIVFYLIFALAFLLRKRLPVRTTAASILATLCAVFFFNAIDGMQTRFTMLDVGQGQCLYFQDGDCRVVIDCGGSDGDEAGEALARRLISSGSTEIDALILTHYDSDHVGGLEQLFRRVTIKTLFLPSIEADSTARAEVITLAQQAQTEIVFVETELLLDFASTQLQIYPPTFSLNENQGLALLLSFDECDILVTGDMDIDAESRLLHDYDIPQVEVLVAGHHGSKYSTGELLLEQASPLTVLISVGENIYGHPTAEVLDRIAAIGAAVYRTDRNGDITITR